jgi:hypothetical protein
MASPGGRFTEAWCVRGSAKGLAKHHRLKAEFHVRPFRCGFMLSAWYCRTGWFAERQFGQEAFGWGRMRVNQNERGSVLHFRTMCGNFLPKINELVIRSSRPLVTELGKS